MKSFFKIVLLALYIISNEWEIKAQVLDSIALTQARIYKSLDEALKSPDNVYRLHLRKKKIKAIPAEISRFKNLNELVLSNNKISVVPGFLTELPYLQVLDLSNNNIKSIPAAIAQLKYLHTLILNRNSIPTLPPEMGNMYSLRILDLWGTEIDQLPYEISKLKHTLLKLDMRVIYMSRTQQDEIHSWFPNTIVLFSKACNCQ